MASDIVGELFSYIHPFRVTVAPDGHVIKRGGFVIELKELHLNWLLENMSFFVVPAAEFIFRKLGHRHLGH